MIVLDNLSPQIHGDNSELLTSIVDDCEFVLGDVRNRTDWRRCLEGSRCSSAPSSRNRNRSINVRNREIY